MEPAETSDDLLKPNTSSEGILQPRAKKKRSLFRRGASRPGSRGRSRAALREGLGMVNDAPVSAGPDRRIYANNSAAHEDQAFDGNYVVTSKYTWLTFLPLFLFNQFKRVANIYFLLISILQLIPGLSPTGSFTTLLTLLFVLAINAIKEIYEDFKRHRDDKVVNNRLITVVRDGAAVELTWAEIQVGDLCELHHGDFIPADCVALWSSEEQGVVYVETSSLDGETNLKRRNTVAETQEVLGQGTVAQVAAWRGTVTARFPAAFLTDFSGTITPSPAKLPDDMYPLGSEQLLLRGSSVRNTKLCWALVLYTGSDTKLVLNSKPPPFKRTNVEIKTNRYIFAVLALLLLVSLGCAIGSGIYLGLDSFGGARYLFNQNVNVAGQAALNFLTFFILFGQMIPISLYTSMEIVRLFQGFFMQQDLSMYYAKNDVPMVARSTTLNEELGQVSMIFSDKTGTLTQNQMQFRKCIVEGRVYGRGYTEIGLLNARRRGDTIDESLVTDDSKPLEDPFVNFDDPGLLEQLKAEPEGALHEFLLALALCHTIVPETNKRGELEYQASSPDEMALARAAKSLGYYFCARKGSFVSVDVLHQRREFEVLNVLEFNSDRKRMSVVLVDKQTGVRTLYCKGADSVIQARVRTSPHMQATLDQLQVLGAEGLRTLMVAKCVLDDGVYTDWAHRYEKAALLLNGRHEALAELSEEIERNMELLGATAIEDKLQVGVPDAIEQLLRANLSIFILTGDKQETAINIGFACSLLNDDMERMIMNIEEFPELGHEERDAKCVPLAEALLDRYLENTEGASDGNEQLALIINGFTLHYAAEQQFGLQDKFLTLVRRCKSIICCRVTPKQKERVVQLHKRVQNKITLAIGDGANDVAMISAAHVGVGINGEEGLQAVRSADYAIGQFRFLVPLLLIHGRYSYRRMTKLIMYSFYKNVFLVMTQFWYAIFNQFTGTSLYEEWTLALYNVVFTSVPIVVFAVMDEDVSKGTVLANPQLYQDGQSNSLFTLYLFVRWVANGVWMSAVVFFVGFGTYTEDVMALDGKSMGLYIMGYAVFTGMVLAVNVRLAQEVKKWDWTLHLSVWGSILVWYIWGAIYSPLWPKLKLGYNMFWVAYVAFGLPSYWLTTFLMVVMCMLISFTWTYVKRTYFPEDYHVIQEQDILRKKVQLPESAKLESQLFAPKPISNTRYSGFAFAPGDETTLRRTVRRSHKADWDGRDSAPALVKEK